MTASAKQWERAIALYDAEVAYVDHKIGELIDFLDYQGVLEETIIIITADHGDFLGERGLAMHTFDLGEPLTHVPLVIRYPNQIENGLVIDDIVELRDIPHTLGKITEVDNHLTQSCYPARNLFQLGQNSRKFAYAERRESSPPRREQLRKMKWRLPFLSHDRDAQLIRTDEWEFIVYGNGERALYRIEQDPREEYNLIGNEKETADSLQRTLEEFVLQHEPTSSTRADAEPSDEVLERLRALGYL